MTAYLKLKRLYSKMVKATKETFAEKPTASTVVFLVIVVNIALRESVISREAYYTMADAIEFIKSRSDAPTENSGRLIGSLKMFTSKKNEYHIKCVTV